MTFIYFILIISILVFIHELGHFIVARYLGVEVEVFSIGFGKKIFSKKYKGTLWQVALIPLGGYVKMKGQDDTKPLKKNDSINSYNSKTPLQKIAILLAGPFANFILAFFIYIIIALNGSNALKPTIGKILPNSPAYKAGLKTADQIIQINNIKIKQWSTISKVINNSKKALVFIIKRENKIYQKTIYPKIETTKNIFKENIRKKMIGISPNGEIITIKYSLYESLIYAYNKTVQATKLIVISVQKLIVGIIPTKDIGGIISISQIISQASQLSIISLLYITALLSVNLGVLNLLPIPALDGGHIMFNLYEYITKRKPNQKVFIYMTIMGWFILVSLMLLGIYNDILRLLNIN